MDTNFDQIDFGPLKPYLEDDDITDISYDNDGQIHLKTLSKGIFRIENPQINNSFMEKLAFQCSNVMGKTFNMAHPFLDAESAELRLAFIHESVSRNGIACVLRKTPAKIRLQKEKIVADKYVELDIVEFLEQCVLGHCNMIVSGETGSGKTELVKYLASKIAENEKIITIEDTLELHLDRIFPHRDIVSMKTNNIASYTDILEACMRQNPKWILLSEVRSAEAVLAVRNSISSGHYILSTIHADKASSIPNRLYSLLETNQDLDQFMSSICRYIQLGIYVRGYTDKATHNFKREIAEVTEFYVDSNTNKSGYNIIYRKGADGKIIRNNPSPYLIDYLEVQGVFLPKELQNMAGDVSNENTNSIDTPLSQADISDNQTVIFNSDGAKIEEKTAETISNGLNPIEAASYASGFNNSVPEVSSNNESIVNNKIDEINEPSISNAEFAPQVSEVSSPDLVQQTEESIVQEPSAFNNLSNNIVYTEPIGVNQLDVPSAEVVQETVQPMVQNFGAINSAPNNVGSGTIQQGSGVSNPDLVQKTAEPIVQESSAFNNLSNNIVYTEPIGTVQQTSGMQNPELVQQAAEPIVQEPSAFNSVSNNIGNTEPIGGMQQVSEVSSPGVMQEVSQPIVSQANNSINSSVINGNVQEPIIPDQNILEKKIDTLFE